METLVIRYADAAGARSEWVVVGEHGVLPGSESAGQVRDALAQAAGRRVVVLAPASEVLLSQAELPTRNRQQMMQAAPYALEDQVADDIESLHFALGVSGDGPSAIAVTARANMERWLAPFREAGVHPASMLPDVLAVPQEADGWGVTLVNGSALIRTGPRSGFAVDRENLPELLPIALDEAGDAAPRSIRLSGGDDDGLVAGALAGRDVRVARGGTGSALASLAAGVRAGRPLDLLQGDFDLREQSARAWRLWSPALALLVVWGVSAWTLDLIEMNRLAAQSAELDARIEQVYRDAFPKARNVSNPRAQMEQKLRALSGDAPRGAGFLPMLGEVGAALAAAGGLRIDRIDYREGRLDIDLRAGDLQQIEQVKQRIVGDGRLEVGILATTRDADGVSGKLRVRERH